MANHVTAPLNNVALQPTNHVEARFGVDPDSRRHKDSERIPASIVTILLGLVQAEKKKVAFFTSSH